MTKRKTASRSFTSTPSVQVSKIKNNLEERMQVRQQLANMLLQKEQMQRELGGEIEMLRSQLIEVTGAIRSLNSLLSPEEQIGVLNDSQKQKTDSVNGDLGSDADASSTADVDGTGTYAG